MFEFIFNLSSTRSVTAFKGDCKVIKLFAKHIKVSKFRGSFDEMANQSHTIVFGVIL